MHTTPVNAKLSFRAGARHTLGWTWRVNGAVVDLTGWAGLMHVRDKAGTLLYTLTTGTPGVGDGTITCTAGSPNVTFGPMPGPLVEGEYVYDMRLTAPAGTEIGYLAGGTVTVVGSVTR